MLTFNNEKIQDALICPICKSKISISKEGSGRFFCHGTRTHSYDFASAGYVNLSSPSQSGGGDSKQAVCARTDFLDLGYYAPIKDKIVELLKKYKGNANDLLIVDAGCGEGYYSSHLAAQGFATLGFDLSKYAVETAAKRARRLSSENAFFGVASVYSLPLFDGVADAVVNVFAPCAEMEYSRILKKSGILIVVGAGPYHLAGLKRVLYNEVHTNESRADMPNNLSHVASERIRYTIELTNNVSILDLFAMTPYYWRTSPSDMDKLDGLEYLSTEVDVIFEIYKKD